MVFTRFHQGSIKVPSRVHQGSIKGPSSKLGYVKYSLVGGGTSVPTALYAWRPDPQKNTGLWMKIFRKSENSQRKALGRWIPSFNVEGIVWHGREYVFLCCHMLVLNIEGRMRTCTFGFNVHKYCEKDECPLARTKCNQPSWCYGLFFSEVWLTWKVPYMGGINGNPKFHLKVGGMGLPSNRILDSRLFLPCMDLPSQQNLLKEQSRSTRKVDYILPVSFFGSPQSLAPVAKSPWRLSLGRSSPGRGASARWFLASNSLLLDTTERTQPSQWTEVRGTKPTPNVDLAWCVEGCIVSPWTIGGP